MPTDSRASGNSLSPSRIRSGDGTEVACDAGQAHVPSNRGHAGDIRLKKPVADEDREALRRLVEAGKVIRRSDMRWGTTSKPLMTGPVAARLKERKLAVAGFEKLTMVPSDKGKRLYAEMKNASGD